MNRTPLHIVACIRNEEHRIAEWIDYHSRLGVSRFHLYLDNCTDSTEERIRKVATPATIRVVYHTEPKGFYDLSDSKDPKNYAKREVVQRIERAYNNAINWIARTEPFAWALFIDADEFLIPTNGVLDWSIFNNSRFQTIHFNSYDYEPVRVDPHYTVLLQSQLRWSEKTRAASPYASRYKSAARVDRIFTINDVHHIRQIGSRTVSPVAHIGHFRQHPYHMCKEGVWCQSSDMKYDEFDASIRKTIDAFVRPNRWLYSPKTTHDTTQPDLLTPL